MRTLALLVSVLVACASPKVAPPSGPTEPPATETTTAPPVAPPPADAPPAPPAPPALTSAKISKAYDEVSVIGTWDEVMGKLTARLGPPTRVGGTALGAEKTGGPLQLWTVVEDDRCYMLFLQTDSTGLKHASYGSFKRGAMGFDQCDPVSAP